MQATPDDRLVSHLTPKSPLADRMRPRNLGEFIGQNHLLEGQGVLRQMAESESLSSFILWGPPGVGKTTLARLLTDKVATRWLQFSAVTAGIKEIKQVMSEAEALSNIDGRRTILFVDEVHRFNKAQQDAFLPYVENGTIVLVGATTENPSFEVNSALLSRMRVFLLHELTENDLLVILRRALNDAERGLGKTGIKAEDDVLQKLAAYASGDARTALNSLDLAALLCMRRKAAQLSEMDVTAAIQQSVLKYDKNGENHFNLISALHKSMRNSDADASLYWLARMLEAGEDALYVARRIVRFASEDIGLAAPQALGQAVDAMRAVQLIGMPEGKLALAQAVVYMAHAPKSNAIYKGYEMAAGDALNTTQHPVPLHLRNATTNLMKEIGYGQGYEYAHDKPNGRADEMTCLPKALLQRKYFQPTARGFEAKLSGRESS